MHVDVGEEERLMHSNEVMRLIAVSTYHEMMSSTYRVMMSGTYLSSQVIHTWI